MRRCSASKDVTLDFTDDGIAEIARCAQRMNERVENIGARRLHTIMEKVLEDVSFDATEHAGETITSMPPSSASAWRSCSPTKI